MWKKNKILFNLSFALIFSLVISVFFQNYVYAGTNTKIYVNGYNSDRFPTPVLIDGYSYVPVDSLEMLLGLNVGYDKDTGIINLSQPDFNSQIQMTIGKNTALINNKQCDLPNAPFIIDGKPMVSLRLVSEAIGGKIIWHPDYSEVDYFLSQPKNKILIYSPNDVKLDSSNVSISSKIYSDSNYLTDSEGVEKSIGYDLVLPVLSGLEDIEFQKAINEQFAFIYESIKNGIEIIYNEQKIEQPDYMYNASNDLQYTIVYDSPDLISLVFDEYAYYGGAHGMPYRYAFNISIKNSKILSLSDLFLEGKDYESKLVNVMNTIRITSSSMEYTDVEEVKSLPETQMLYELENYSFFIKDDILQIFYHPYELSYYARGFVDFRIPLESLIEYITYEYSSLTK